MTMAFVGIAEAGQDLVRMCGRNFGMCMMVCAFGGGPPTWVGQSAERETQSASQDLKTLLSECLLMSVLLSSFDGGPCNDSTPCVGEGREGC